ncbi:MAG: DNA repair protein RecN [Thermoleophilia bacterium]|nr:DNA repair protein RecN [Thermoleophilia bacterium]
MPGSWIWNPETGNWFSMLSELRIENLAVISRADLVLSRGLNVITGETGAGKTILAHAISLILGTRAGGSLIRPGADEASVEAIFKVPPDFFSDIGGVFDIPDDEELIVRRRLSREGHSRAYIGGRATTLAVLEQVTGRLLAFSAQHEHRRLMMASRQLDILDAFAGPQLLGTRERHETLYKRRHELAARLEELARSAEAGEREAELLSFQVAEIESAALVPGEDAELEARRQKLLAAEELGEAAAGLAVLLGRDESGDGFLDALAAAMSRLDKSRGIDTELDSMAERLTAGFYELEEIGRFARSYSETVHRDPGRLQETEERLDLISRLKRKFGASIEEINEFAKKASERLARLTDDGRAKSLMEADLSGIEQEMAALAQKLRGMRNEASGHLERETMKHLADLAFNRCDFRVRLSPVDIPVSTGADAVEFLVSPNPGMPASPVRESASGGELSRIMLAIKSSASSESDAATLVFDEIDAGIGGETGLAVGAKLKSLAAGSQVVCITHLPQIACFADAHLSVVKESGLEETATRVNRLEGEEIIDELCRMMGSKPADKKARAHAASLLENAASAPSWSIS